MPKANNPKFFPNEIAEQAALVVPAVAVAPAPILIHQVARDLNPALLRQRPANRQRRNRQNN